VLLVCGVLLLIFYFLIVRPGESSIFLSTSLSYCRLDAFSSDRGLSSLYSSIWITSSSISSDYPDPSWLLSYMPQFDAFSIFFEHKLYDILLLEVSITEFEISRLELVTFYTPSSIYFSVPPRSMIFLFGLELLSIYSSVYRKLYTDLLCLNPNILRILALSSDFSWFMSMLALYWCIK